MESEKIVFKNGDIFIKICNVQSKFVFANQAVEREILGKNI